jgi:hypothetical protein
MASPTQHPRPESQDSKLRGKRALLVVLGLTMGVLIALLTLVIVLARRATSEPHWPVVRLFANPAYVAIGSFAALTIWAAWEGGHRVWALPNSLTHAVGSSVAVLRAFAFAFLVTAIIGGAALSLVPAYDTDIVGGIRLVPILPPPLPAAPRIAYVVFFPNGSSTIPPLDQAPLRHFFHELSPCKGLTIRLRAFVSSASYATDDERQNDDLLQHRLDAVAQAAKAGGINAVDPHHWPSRQEMQLQRGFVDQVNDRRLVAREAFNRRVEILVTSYGDCGEQTASSAGTTMPKGHLTPPKREDH